LGYASKYVPGHINRKQGIQVGTKFEGKITRDEKGKLQFDMDGIHFLQQLGVEWVMISGNQVPEHTVDTFLEVKERLAEFGLQIYCLHSQGYHNMPDVTLGLENRDSMIEKYLEHITRLGKAGIRYSTYAHMGNGIWRNDARHTIRGGATSGGLNFGEPNRAQGKFDFTWPLSHGRVYTEDELWKNYEYFIKQVAPVAESAGVYIGVHPDDPPIFTVAGVPRCIFGNFEGYKRAIDLANSPNIGTCLCVGCWLEGGEAIGCSPEEFIKYFGARKKLFKLHMRNVSEPMTMTTGFDETFPDEGYYNLANVIKALDDIEFDGAIINDHLVSMVGGHYASEAAMTMWLQGAVAGIQNHRIS
jgi:mannonate dehydratase